MLLVKTYLAQSQIEGYGVFADQFIPAGTPIWNFDPTVDMALDMVQADRLSPAFREYFERYAYLDVRLRKYVICGDDARFVNHSDTPNMVGIYTIGREYGIDVALRSIQKGEELTSDYSTFDSDFGSKLDISTHMHV